MKRPDWRARLSAYLIEVGDKPFAYGEFDCALFVAGAVEAMTGENHADGFAKYGSLRTGLNRLKKEGFDDHFDFLEKTFSEGDDVVIVNGPAGRGLGVRYRNRVYCLSEAGPRTVPLSFIEKGYAV